MGNQKTKLITLDKLWMSSTGRAQFNGLELAPGEAERTLSGALNLYKGYSVEPSPGNVQHYRDLLGHVISDKRDQDRFEQFTAYKFQNPGASYSHALVLQSMTQGVGKNLLVESCAGLFHSHHHTVVGQEVFSDQFNDWQHQKLIVVADEVSSVQSRTVADKVKSWVTATENNINGKGQPRYQEVNKIVYYFISNHPDAVYMDKNDRRFDVLACGSNKLKEADAEKFIRWRDNGGASHLLDYFLQLDTTGFNPRAHAPMSAAKRNMINANKSNLERWVETVITAGNVQALLGREIATAEELTRRYHRDTGSDASAKAMAGALARAGVKQLNKQAKLANSTRVRVYALKNAANYTNLSCSQLGDVMDQNLFSG